ncbi:MAG: Biopolymer transport protein ExbD [Synechococcus sp. CC9902]|nr:MAG: Biopolymer transport protein ExbD [Synechococcus sp. CC9902]
MRKKYQSIRLNPESDVNVLPLIDVLFAILLFFMLSSIILTEKNQITVQRPSNSQTERVGKGEKILTVTLQKDKKLYLEDEEVPVEQLTERLNLLTKDNSANQILIDADKGCSYGDVMDVLDAIKAANLNSIGLAVNKREISG